MRYTILPWLCLLAATPAAAKPPRILPIPARLPGEVGASLETHRTPLLKQRKALKKQVRTFNRDCRDFAKRSQTAAQCAADGQSLREALGVGAPYARAVEAFNRFVERVTMLSSRCAAFAKDKEHHRHAQIEQQKASALVAEASAVRGGAVVERAALTALRLGKLAAKFVDDPIAKTLIKGAEIYANPAMRQAVAELGPAAMLVKDLNVVLTWDALNVARKAQDCGDKVKHASAQGYAAVHSAIAAGKCVELLGELGNFATKHGEALNKIGKVAGVAVAAIELGKEAYELAAELRGFKEQVDENPTRALEATKHLDCEKELRDTLAEGPK